MISMISGIMASEVLETSKHQNSWKSFALPMFSMLFGTKFMESIGWFVAFVWKILVVSFPMLWKPMLQKPCKQQMKTKKTMIFKTTHLFNPVVRSSRSIGQGGVTMCIYIYICVLPTVCIFSHTYTPVKYMCELIKTCVGMYVVCLHVYVHVHAHAHVDVVVDVQVNVNVYAYVHA